MLITFAPGAAEMMVLDPIGEPARKSCIHIAARLQG